MKKKRPAILAQSIGALLALTALAPLAPANQIWDGGGANDFWSTKENWGLNLLPNFGSTLTFGGVLRLTPVNSSQASVAGLNFNASAGAFTLTGSGVGDSITLGGNITNNSTTSAQTISFTTITLSGNRIFNAATNPLTVNSNIVLGANTLTAEATNDITLNGAITGTGGLVKNGASTLFLGGTNTYSGTTTLNDGQLSAQFSGSLSPNSTFIVQGTSTLDVNGNDNTIGALNDGGVTTGRVVNSIVAAATLTVGNGNATGSFGGTIENLGGVLGIRKIGTGTQILSNTNTYIGETTVDAGRLEITGSAGSTVVTVNGGTLLVGKSGALPGVPAVSVTGGGFEYHASTNTPLALSGLALTSGPGTTIGGSLGSTLTGAQIAVAGAVSPTLGAVKVNVFAVPGVATGAPGTYVLLSAGAGSTLSTDATYSLGTITNPTNFTVGAPVATATTLTVQLTAATPLANAFWVGGLGIGPGDWSLSTGTATNWASDNTGTATPLVPGAGTNVFFSAGSPATPTSPVGMSLGSSMAIGSLTVNAATAPETRTVTLADTTGNTLTVAGAGGITINSGAGAVTLNPKITVGAAQTWTNNSANLFTLGGTVSNGANRLTVAGTGNTTFTGELNNGPGGLTKADTGRLTLTRSTLNTGGALLTGGELFADANGAFGSGTLAIASAGGTVTLGSNTLGTTLVNPISVQSNFTVVAPAAGNHDFVLAGPMALNGATRTISSPTHQGQVHFSGVISNGGLTFTTAGLPADADANNASYVAYIHDGAASHTYTGLTTVEAKAFLVLQSAGEKFKGDVLIQGNGVVDYLGFSDQIADTATVTVNSTGSRILGGTAFQGLELFNNNDTIGSLFGTGTVGLGSGTLTVGAGNLTGIITNGERGSGGNFVKNTAGALTLAGANNYTGTTTVTAGTLNVTGSLTSTAINVTGGTFIAGKTGALAAAANVSVATGAGFEYHGATDAPLAIGALTLNSGAGTTIGGSIGAGPTSAQITVAGNVTPTAGAIQVNVFGVPGLGARTPGTYTLLTAGAGSTLNAGTTYTLGSVFNAGDFTVGTPVATATTITIPILAATPLADAFWVGGFSGNPNDWAASNGTTTSNWATNNTGTATPLVPGAGTNVFFSAGSPATPTSPSAMILGDNMAIANLTVNGATAPETRAITLGASGGRTLTLAGTGGITINAGAGAVTLNPSMVLGANQTWTNNSANLFTAGGNVSNGANLLTVAGSGNTTLAGVIGNGTGGLTKSGTGKLTLAGANTYTGTTTVSGGTLDVSGSLTSAAINVTGGTFIAEKSNSVPATAAVTVAVGSGFEYRGATDAPLTIGSLTLTSGSGTTLGGTIGAAPTSATINVTTAVAPTPGAIQVNVFGVPGLGARTPGTYTLLSAAAGSTLATGTTYTLGSIFNAGNFTVSGLTATPTTITVGIGTLNPLPNAFWVGGLAGNPSDWAASNGTTTSNWATDNTGTATPLVPGAGTNVFFSAGSPAAPTSPSAMILGDNMVIASLTVNAATAPETRAVTLGASGGRTLTLAGTGGITINAGAGAVTLNPNMVLGANQTWTNNSANLFTAGGSVTNASNTLTVAGSGNTTLAGVLGNGSGGLSKTGAGTLTLSAANTYTGTTTVAAGTLNVSGSVTSATINVTGGTFIAGKAGALPAAANVSVATGAGFEYRAPTNAPLAIGALTLHGGAGTTIGGSIGGSPTSAQITVAGNVLPTAGAIQVNVFGIPGLGARTPGTYTLLTAGAGSTLNVGTTYTLGNIFNASNFTVSAPTATATAITVQIAAATPLANAFWVGGLSGSPNDWASSNGSTASNWASDNTGTPTPLVPGATTNVFFSAGSPATPTSPGSMTIGDSMSIASLTVNAAAAPETRAVTLASSGGNTLTVGAGGITIHAGAGAVTLNPNMVLGAAETWTNNSANLFTAGGNVSNGANLLTVAGSGDTRIAGVLGNGAGGVTKTGAGRLTLAGSNTYTGDTRLAGGALFADTNTALGTGPLTIEAAATLGSNNTGTRLANPISVQADFSVIAPAGGNHDFSLNGAMDLNGATRTITGLTHQGQVHFGGVISNGGLTFTTSGLPAPANGDNSYVAFIHDGAASHTYTGLTTVEKNAFVVLQSAGEKFRGNILIQDEGVVDYLGFGNQIADTATVTVNSPGSTILGGIAFAGFELRDFDDTIGVLNGSSVGTVGLGSATLTVGAGNFNGVIRDGTVGSGTAGQLVKNTTGTLTLSGANTYTGNTFVNNGTLVLNGSVQSPTLLVNFAGTLMGTGTAFRDVRNAGTFAPGDGRGTFHIRGNYLQTGAGTMVIEIAGTKSGEHDLVAVGGRAVLDGTLRLVKVGNARLKPGDKVTFLTATGGVTGRFSTEDNELSTTRTRTKVTSQKNAAGKTVPTAQTVHNLTGTIVETDVVYENNAVSLEARQGSFELLAQELRFTPNQSAVSTMLDRVARRSASKDQVIDFLNGEPLANLPADFDRIAPEELQAIFTIGTSQANVQTANLQRRLEDVRAGRLGFSADGLAVTGPGFLNENPVGAQGPVGPANPGTREIQPPETAAPTEQRYGAFITGTGEFASVGHTQRAGGYDLASGGFTIGVDYKLNDHFTVGLNTGYARTGTDGFGGSRVTVDGAKLGAYATYFTGEGFYADAAIQGGYNSYDTRRSALRGTASGSTTGGEATALVAAGFDFTDEALRVGPIASFQYTHVGFSGYGESGSLAPLRYGSQSSTSMRSALGLKASYEIHHGRVLIRPEMRAAWQHEFGDIHNAIDSALASGGPTFTVQGAEIGRESLLLGLGVAVLWNERTATYLYYDGELLRSNYTSNNVSAGVRMSF